MGGFGVGGITISQDSYESMVLGRDTYLFKWYDSQSKMSGCVIICNEQPILDYTTVIPQEMLKEPAL